MQCVISHYNFFFGHVFYSATWTGGPTPAGARSTAGSELTTTRAPSSSVKAARSPAEQVSESDKESMPDSDVESLFGEGGKPADAEAPKDDSPGKRSTILYGRSTAVFFAFQSPYAIVFVV